MGSSEMGRCLGLSRNNCDKRRHVPDALQCRIGPYKQRCAESPMGLDHLGRSGAGIASSRCFPPTPAAIQATAAPNSAADPMVNAKITLLRLARRILSLALVMAVSARICASAGARPVLAAVRRMR